MVLICVLPVAVAQAQNPCAKVGQKHKDVVTCQKTANWVAEQVIARAQLIVRETDQVLQKRQALAFKEELSLVDPVHGLSAYYTRELHHWIQRFNTSLDLYLRERKAILDNKQQTVPQRNYNDFMTARQRLLNDAFRLQEVVAGWVTTQQAELDAASQACAAAQLLQASQSFFTNTQKAQQSISANTLRTNQHLRQADSVLTIIHAVAQTTQKAVDSVRQEVGNIQRDVRDLRAYAYYPPPHRLAGVQYTAGRYLCVKYMQCIVPAGASGSLDGLVVAATAGGQLQRSPDAVLALEAGPTLRRVGVLAGAAASFGPAGTRAGWSVAAVALGQPLSAGLSYSPVIGLGATMLLRF